MKIFELEDPTLLVSFLIFFYLMRTKFRKPKVWLTDSNCRTAFDRFRLNEERERTCAPNSQRLIGPASHAAEFDAHVQVNEA